MIDSPTPKVNISLSIHVMFSCRWEISRFDLPFHLSSLSSIMYHREVKKIILRKIYLRSGITLVEVLVASAVLSMLVSFGYKVFFAVSASFQKGNWALATQSKLRNGLNFVREEMQKASYHSRVQVNGTVVTKDDYEFSLSAADEIVGNGNIAKWFIGFPFKSSDGTGAVFECELKLVGGSLLYSKQILDGGEPSERTFNNHIVIENVSKITLALEPVDPDEPLSGNMVVLDVEIEHADKVRHPEAKVMAQTGAKVQVEVKRTP